VEHEVVRTVVRHDAYFDSVALMRASAQLNASSGVLAALVMGTPANKQILEQAGLLTAEGQAAGPNDLLIAIRAERGRHDELLRKAEAELLPRASTAASVTASPVVTLREAVANLPGANLAIISTPGRYAAAEALKAINVGLHAFVFSNNVAIGDERMIKQEAAKRGLLVMGPDCGTSIIGGVPLGFANTVRRGDIGLIGASGTGLQEVSCLIDRAGCGISHLIGVGSHDMSEEVGSTTTLQAIDLLGEDPTTQLIVLVSKAPAGSEATRVLEHAASRGKPVVVCFLGDGTVVDLPSIHWATTLEEAADVAVALRKGTAPVRRSDRDPEPILERLGPGRRYIRALFTGGSFAAEAKSLLGPVADSLTQPALGEIPSFPADHVVLDMGADDFTVGRPHPMIDPTLRTRYAAAAAASRDTSVLIVDVVLGHGSSMAPTEGLDDVIRAASNSNDGGPVVIAFVCGTEADPQQLSKQERVLATAGAIVVPTSTAAIRLAKEVAARATEVAAQ
jgi:succinyl-CoA synthetase alpha subunit